MSPEATPSLPPAAAIQNQILSAESPRWFEYIVRAHPHHTDYAGIVWHGAYIAWMEEARVEYLRSIGIDFASLVAMGCNLVVVELSIRYQRPIFMGETAAIKVRTNLAGVRINCDYEIQSLDAQEICSTAKVVLAPVDREKGKVMRQLPPDFQAALTKFWQ